MNIKRKTIELKLTRIVNQLWISIIIINKNHMYLHKS